MEVRTREAFPQAWAMTQNNLALALNDQAGAVEGGERRHLLVEAARAMRAHGTVYTEEVDPEGFRERQRWIEAVEAKILKLEAP